MLKAHYFELDEQDMSIAEKYFQRNLHPKYTWTIRGKCQEVFQPVPDDATIIPLALKYYQRYGFAMDKDIYHVEINCYNDKTSPQVFDVHCDNYATLPCKVHTLVLYLENTFQAGGELEIYTSTGVQRVPIRSGMGLAMSGDVRHMPTKCQGQGCRRLIVIHMARSQHLV